jgi:hypothetical protein
MNKGMNIHQYKLCWCKLHVIAWDCDPPYK